MRVDEGVVPRYKHSTSSPQLQISHFSHPNSVPAIPAHPRSLASASWDDDIIMASRQIRKVCDRLRRCSLCVLWGVYASFWVAKLSSVGWTFEPMSCRVFSSAQPVLTHAINSSLLPAEQIGAERQHETVPWCRHLSHWNSGGKNSLSLSLAWGAWMLVWYCMVWVRRVVMP